MRSQGLVTWLRGGATTDTDIWFRSRSDRPHLASRTQWTSSKLLIFLVWQTLSSRSVHVRFTQFVGISLQRSGKKNGLGETSLPWIARWLATASAVGGAACPRTTFLSPVFFSMHETPARAWRDFPDASGIVGFIAATWWRTASWPSCSYPMPRVSFAFLLNAAISSTIGNF